ncbi:MAG: sulfatase-like hydrolase/transferase [Acidobacteria bacterium]|nr:sulfatase-like hydrolase/transferase [Acidobacteriota bacterium]
MILAGNFGSWMLGCYGNAEFRTPNLDQLARTGTRFAASYSGTPDAAGSHAILLSGRMPAGGAGIADVLAGQGYACGAADNTVKACEFLDHQDVGKPFFLVAGYPEDQAPAQKYLDLYTQTKFQRPLELLADVKNAAAAASALDAEIPALLTRLHDRKLADTTLIVFCGLNGRRLGRDGMYDEVVRVPMICSWLGRIPVQSVRPEVVSLYDVFPALCEAAGAPLPADKKLCGRSCLALARNQPLPKKKPWRNLVFGKNGKTEMVRDARYKLILDPNQLFDLTADAGEKTNQYDNPGFVSVRDRLTSELAARRKQYS